MCKYTPFVHTKSLAVKHRPRILGWKVSKLHDEFTNESKNDPSRRATTNSADAWITEAIIFSEKKDSSR